MNDLDWHWLAGLFEGEGTALLRYRERKNWDGPLRPTGIISIDLTDEDVLLHVQEVFGGNLYGPYQKKALRADGTPHLPSWTWSVSKASEVLRIARGIRPYAFSRRGQKLDEVIDALKDSPAVGKGSYVRTEEFRQRLSQIRKGKTVSEWKTP